MYSLSKFPIQIPKSKTRAALLFSASVILVISGMYLLIKPSVEVGYLLGNKLSIIIIAIITIVFFGVKLVFLLHKLLDTTPGLEISELGITDHYSKADAGLLKWHDIKDIQLIKVFHFRIFMIFLNNPEEYIEGQSNANAKKVMEMNYQMYGSPVGLSAAGLKINFSSLKILLNESFCKFNNL